MSHPCMSANKKPEALRPERLQICSPLWFLRAMASVQLSPEARALLRDALAGAIVKAKASAMAEAAAWQARALAAETQASALREEVLAQLEVEKAPECARDALDAVSRICRPLVDDSCSHTSFLRQGDKRRYTHPARSDGNHGSPCCASCASPLRHQRCICAPPRRGPRRARRRAPRSRSPSNRRRELRPERP